MGGPLVKEDLLQCRWYHLPTYLNLSCSPGALMCHSFIDMRHECSRGESTREDCIHVSCPSGVCPPSWVAMMYECSPGEKTRQG